MSKRNTLFERQAAWQRARAKLSWTEKLRLAVILRELALSMRRTSKEHGNAAAVVESLAKYGR